MNSSISTWLNQGLNAIQANDYALALEIFSKALQNEPHNAEILYQIGKIYQQLNQPQKALETFESAVQLSPQSALIHFELGQLFRQRQSLEEALRHYHHALTIAPDFVHCHMAVGLLFLQQGELKNAKIQFNNVLSLAPEHIRALFYIGIIALAEEDLSTAQNAFEHVILNDPEDVESLVNLGVIALKSNEAQSAIDYFSKALAIDNEKTEARSNLAATFMHFNRFENALIHYDILLKSDPHNIEYLYNSGVALMALGQLETASTYFQKILNSQPQHFESLTNLAAIHLKMGERAEAQTLYQQAHLLRPEDKVIRFMQQALSPVENSIEHCPEYAKNLFDQYALYYDTHMQKTLEYALPNILEKSLLSLNLQNTENILDLGCGTGLSGQVLKPYAKTLVGVDISPQMIAQAHQKKLYDELLCDNITTYLKKTSKPFEMIVALDVFPYFGDLEELFTLITKSLSPQGFLIFSTEISHKASVHLQTTARFCHNKTYLQQLFKKYSLQILHETQVEARRQDTKKIAEYFFVLQKKD